MARRELIRDFKRPITHRHSAPIDIQSTTPIRPVKREVSNDNINFLDIKKSRPKPKPVQSRQNKSRVLKRQGLKKLPAFTPRKAQKHLVRIFALTFSFVLVSGLVLNYYSGKRTSNKAREEQSVMSATDTKSASPIETEPSLQEVKSYEVTPDMPRYFKSKRLSIDARIKEVTIEDSKITTPENIYDIGWYKDGGKPGQGKATLLAGSVSGQSKNGVFGRIGSLKKGDVLSVEMGDGTTHNYVVRSTKSYPKNQINYDELLMSLEPGKESLNLIALANRFDIRAQNFEDNFAAFATKE